MAKNDVDDAFGTLVVTMLFLSPTILVGCQAYETGVEEGRKQVASGEVVCELVEREFNEIEWMCRKSDV